MTWKIFAGEQSDVISALVVQRAIADGLNDSSEDRADCVRAHISRGLEYLGSGRETKSIATFLGRWALKATDSTDKK